MWDVIEILENQFGRENITGFSIHKDETNVHMHISFTPVYTSEKNGKMKCSINQTKFFKNPRQLAGLHRQIRKELLEKGYEIEQDNKPIDKYLAGYTDRNGVYHQQGLTPDMLKALSEKELKLRLEEIEMRIRDEDLDNFEKRLNEMRQRQKAKQQELDKEREEIRLRKTSVENDKVNVQAQLRVLLQEKEKVERMKSELKDMTDNVYSTADICNQILDEEKHLNEKFLEFLDREGKRTGKKFREVVESLYKRFQNERRKNVSDWQLEMLRLRNDRLNQNNTATDSDIDIIDTDYGISL